MASDTEPHAQRGIEQSLDPDNRGGPACLLRTAKRRKVDHASSPASSDSGQEEQDVKDEEDTANEDGAEDASGEAAEPPTTANGAEDSEDLLITNPNKLKPLTPEQLAASKAATEKTGVVYLSRIPPFMKPMKVKQLLERFGAVGRIFLSPEDPKSYARRVRFGGNKKKNFEEGWAEFLNKKDAKLVAETLNTTKIGGKKGSYYHDDVWNIKYLPKFKWHHLQAQIAYENASRQAKLRTEISQATRENKTYIRNVGRAKMIGKMETSKRKRTTQQEEAQESGVVVEEEEEGSIQVRRQFRQHKAMGKRAEHGNHGDDGSITEKQEGSEKVKRLLSKLF